MRASGLASFPDARMRLLRDEGTAGGTRTCLRDFIPQPPFLASRRHKQNDFDNEGANSCICFGLRRNRIYATLIGTKNERGRKQAHRLA